VFQDGAIYFILSILKVEEGVNKKFKKLEKFKTTLLLKKLI